VISKKIIQEILRAKDIAVAGHINPDGDSIGSLLSLGLGLKKLGKRVYMISADGVPQRYKKLPGAKAIIKRCKKEVLDLGISVDSSNKEILGSGYLELKKAAKIIEIDHHEFRRPFGDLQLVDPHAAAVAEIIYLLLEKLKVRLDAHIAQNLLTSIIVETDSFRLPQARALTFKICARLLEKGIDFYKLVDMVFWSQTKEAIILSGLCLSRCRFLKNGRLVWSIIRKEDFQKIKGKDQDLDRAADQMRFIKGVKVVVLFREAHKGILRVSLRSKAKYNVALLAEKYGGGGHFDVAGCSIRNSSANIKKFLKDAEKIL